jgi:hypothetical protein
VLQVPMAAVQIITITEQTQQLQQETLATVI